jgi:uncharacterized protein YwgA
MSEEPAIIRAVDRAALPLLLASDRFAPGSEREPLDRLRMQKGVFLLQMRGRQEWAELFPFEPYDWGPFSRELANAVTRLLGLGLLEKESLPNRRYGRYRTTAAGERVVDQAAVELTPEEHNFIASVRRLLTERSFTQLLRDVYAAYPDYAVNSRFQG